MNRNLRFLFCAAFILLFSTSSFAQKFEGAITMAISSVKMPVPMTLVIMTKDDNSAAEMQMPQGSVKIYFDKKKEKITTVFGKMGMEMAMKKAKEEKKDDASETQIVDTKEKKVINGHSCELYHVTAKDSNQSNWWMTDDLPKSLLNSLHEIYENSGKGTMADRNGSPGIAAIREMFKKGLVPIQVEMLKNGSPETTMTFVKYEQKHIDDSEFVIPSDVTIQAMPSMGRE